MVASSATSAVEKLILEAIAARGWTAVTAERRGRDLEVRVECAGIRGRLLFLHECSDDAEFLRIDLGETGGTPELWCITEDNFPVADQEQGRPRQVCQVAIGKGCVSIGAGVFGPTNSGSGEIAPDIDIWRMFAGKLLARAEQLRPERTWNERRALMAELTRLTPLPQPWSPRWRAAIARSRQHPLRAKFELARIESLNSADSCCILPGRWITVALDGPETPLGRLPPGPRETRSASNVRWTFTGDELERGDLGRHFVTVAESLGLVSRSAYR